MSIRTKALLLALLIIAVAVLYRTYGPLKEPVTYVTNSLPVLQAPGTEHSHISFVIVINGTALDFSGDEFMSLDEHAHLHDNSGFFIHKHAHGVTLLYFLKTLGITLTRDCITLGTPAGDGTQYCNDGKAKLTIYVNRAPLAGNLDYYEMRNGDKILIDYSDADETELLLEANGIPDLPDDLTQHG